ncbi:MAG: PTS sugar transporter subunit IIC [Brevinema sp.]
MSFQESLAKVATALSEQRHLTAIRNAFYRVMPLMLVASLYVMLNNVIFGLPGLRDIAALQSFKDVGDRVFRGSLGMVSITVSFLVAYFLAVGYKEREEATFYGVTAVGCFITLIPGVQQVAANDTTVGLWGILQFVDTGAASMFVAMIVAICSAEILHGLSKVEALKIKLPDSVPPAVAKSFSVLIPVTITFTVFGVLGFALMTLWDTTVAQVITKTLQVPVLALLQNPIGLIVVMGIQNLLWFFGVHGAFVLGPMYEPPLLIALNENLAAFQAGGVPTHIITKIFMDCYMSMGGAGNTLALVIAIFIFGRHKEDRLIGGLGFMPGLFNINEPILFGLPIIFNPIYFIPFIFSPIINGLIAYAATAAGLVNKLSILVPWTTPPVLSAFLASGNDFRVALLSLVLLAVSVLVYAPFVMAANRSRRD